MLHWTSPTTCGMRHPNHLRDTSCSIGCPRPHAGCVTPAACSMRRPSPENSTKKLRKIFIDFSLFQLFSFLRLWELHHSEKPEFVSMNCLKDSSRDGLELEIQTSRPRKIAKRAFLVGGILIGIILSVMSKIIISFLSLFSRLLGISGFGTLTNTRNLNSLV